MERAGYSRKQLKEAAATLFAIRPTLHAALAATSMNHCDEKHRSPNRNMPEPLTFRGTDAKEFPILYGTNQACITRFGMCAMRVLSIDCASM
jgi:hypothetical protein